MFIQTFFRGPLPATLRSRKLWNRSSFQKLQSIAMAVILSSSPALAQSKVTATPLRADASTLALFEFDSSAQDSSGNNRHGILIGGTFVPTFLGYGLAVGPQFSQNGMDWSQFSADLRHPFTIEVIATPGSASGWGKIISFDDRNDRGWYYKNRGLQSYPGAVVAPGRLNPGGLHYFAFVSRDDFNVDVYQRGEYLGAVSIPPRSSGEVILFRDDSATGRSEQLDAVVDAVRVSRVQRTVEEMQAVWRELSTVVPAGGLGSTVYAAPAQSSGTSAEDAVAALLLLMIAGAATSSFGQGGNTGGTCERSRAKCGFDRDGRPLPIEMCPCK